MEDNSARLIDLLGEHALVYVVDTLRGFYLRNHRNVTKNAPQVYDDKPD